MWSAAVNSWTCSLLDERGLNRDGLVLAATLFILRDVADWSLRAEGASLFSINKNVSVTNELNITCIGTIVIGTINKNRIETFGLGLLNYWISLNKYSFPEWTSYFRIRNAKFSKALPPTTPVIFFCSEIICNRQQN